MTREEIIKIARATNLDVYGYGTDHERFTATLERFAYLIASNEREACALVCNARYVGDNNREDMEARRCAAAIRARGQE